MDIALIQFFKVHADNSNEWHSTVPFSSKERAIEYLTVVKNYQQCVDMVRMENYWRSENENEKMNARIEIKSVH